MPAGMCGALIALGDIPGIVLAAPPTQRISAPHDLPAIRQRVKATQEGRPSDRRWEPSAGKETQSLTIRLSIVGSNTCGTNELSRRPLTG